jgi:hypothetical protein
LLTLARCSIWSTTGTTWRTSYSIGWGAEGCRLFGERRLPVNRERPTPVALDYDQGTRISSAQNVRFFAPA